MPGPYDVVKSVVARFRSWGRAYDAWEERHSWKADWFQSHIAPIIILVACVFGLFFMPNAFRFDRIASEQQGTRGVLVADFLSCGPPFGCRTRGEWRSDDGQSVIAMAWVDGEYGEGEEIPTQAFPDDGETDVYLLDHAGNPWLVVYTILFAAGGLASLGYLVYVWAPIDLIDWVLERFEKSDGNSP